MTEKTAAASTEDKPKQPQFGIERIYIKDVSLETPKTADEAKRPWSPRVDLDLNTTQKKLESDRYEVTLRLTITVKDQESEEVYYLIEVNQSGQFLAVGFTEEECRRVLATAAPSALFPYAREVIDGLVTKAGYPPLRLAPINFDALVQAAAQQRAANAKSDTVQ